MKVRKHRVPVAASVLGAAVLVGCGPVIATDFLSGKTDKASDFFPLVSADNKAYNWLYDVSIGGTFPDPDGGDDKTRSTPKTLALNLSAIAGDPATTLDATASLVADDATASTFALRSVFGDNVTFNPETDNEKVIDFGVFSKFKKGTAPFTWTSNTAVFTGNLLNNLSSTASGSALTFTVVGLQDASATYRNCLRVDFADSTKKAITGALFLFKGKGIVREELFMSETADGGKLRLIATLNKISESDSVVLP